MNFDAVGNRTSVSDLSLAGAPIDTYLYPNDSNQLSSILQSSGSTRNLTYDAAGNVTSDSRLDGIYSYTYDAANRMSSLSIDGVLQAEYEYNFLGQQVIRKIAATGQTIHNIFDLDGNRIAEYDFDDATNTSTLIREYIWANGVVVAVVENDQTYYVRTDHIGRPVFATNGAGAKVWEVSYKPFGGVDVTLGGAIDLRFPGQWFQAESGLHQNWMRDYDPTTGRYIQADPLGLVDGSSVYGYVLQSPYRYVDPLGLQAQCPTSPPRPGSGDRRCERPEDGWKPYHGDPIFFHCGYEGFLEDREPTPDEPQAECFYDHMGNLVTKNHKFAGCRGTNNQYSSKNDKWNHTWNDTGGIRKSGWEAFWDSMFHSE